MRRVLATIGLVVVVLVAFQCATAKAEIVWAGDHLVDLDATGLAAGPIASWTNAGTLGSFTAVGAPTVQAVDGANAVVLSGVADYFDGPMSVAGIEGNLDVSIEAWVLNPWLASEETILAWGKRGGPDGSNMSFNYGTNPSYGAVGHWGSPDLGWNGAPTRDQWHHLVYTYDGTTQRVYADGVEKNAEILGSLNIAAGRPIRLASQTEGDGVTATGALRGSLALGKVRIHDGVLTATDVLNNYEAEKAAFPVTPILPPTPQPLPTGPVHRYSFAGDATDSVGGADGVLVNNTGNAAYAGGQLILGNTGSQNSNANGGLSDGDYVDLPNGIVSGLGQSGTFEAWTTWTGAAGTAWQRIFDFGTSNGGEGLSSGADVRSYVMLTPRSGDATLRTGYRNGPTADERVVDDNEPMAQGAEKHVVVVWDGAEDAVSLYLDGQFIADNQAHMELNSLIDNNNWLGRAQWPDTMYVGNFNEFRLYDYALNKDQILGNFQAGPDQVNVVPEPTGLALLTLGLLGLLARRRK